MSDKEGKRTRQGILMPHIDDDDDDDALHYLLSNIQNNKSMPPTNDEHTQSPVIFTNPI